MSNNRNVPNVLAHRLESVQPITGVAGEIFNMRKYTIPNIRKPHQGDCRHDFIYGWQRYYGSQWIAETVWVRIKLMGL